MKTLNTHRLTLTAARSNKKSLIESLSARELELLLIAENRNNSIFGGHKNDTIVVTITTVTKKLDSIGRTRTKTSEAMTRTEEQSTINTMVKHGWLRFACGLTDGLGYYFPTISAETVLRAAREGKNPLV